MYNFSRAFTDLQPAAVSASASGGVGTAPPPGTEGGGGVEAAASCAGASGVRARPPGVSARASSVSDLAWGDVVSVVFDGSVYYGRVSGAVRRKPHWFAVDFAVGEELEEPDLYEYKLKELQFVPPDKVSMLTDVNLPPVRAPLPHIKPIPSRDGKMPAAGAADAQDAEMGDIAERDEASVENGAPKQDGPEREEDGGVEEALDQVEAGDEEEAEAKLIAERQLNFERRIQEARARRDKAAKLQQQLALRAPSAHYEW